MYLIAASLLSPFVMGEELFLYLAVTPHAVSSALIRKEGRIPKPVYYTSKALRGAERRYPPIEKLAFALVTASRKFRHLFSRIKLSLPKIISLLTSSSEDLWPVPTGPL